jgi:hypothetical protein
MAFAASQIRRSTASITSLADRVFKVSKQINAYLNENNHGQPNFSPKSPSPPETYEYQGLRNQLSDAALDLVRLANGPRNTFRTFTFSHADLSAERNSPFHKRFGTTFYGAVEAEEARATRFSNAMRSWSESRPSLVLFMRIYADSL